MEKQKNYIVKVWNYVSIELEIKDNIYVCI